MYRKQRNKNLYRNRIEVLVETYGRETREVENQDCLVHRKGIRNMQKVWDPPIAAHDPSTPCLGTLPKKELPADVLFPVKSKVMETFLWSSSSSFLQTERYFRKIFLCFIFLYIPSTIPSNRRQPYWCCHLEMEIIFYINKDISHYDQLDVFNVF